MLEIFGLLVLEDRVSMLRVCSELHFLAARALYSDIRVHGLSARKLFVTLALKSRFSAVYSTFLRRLQYTVTSRAESFLTYPVFCQALLTLDGLVGLGLDLFPGQAEALMMCLRRYSLIKTRVLLGTQLLEASRRRERSSRSTLSSLRGLRIRGDSIVAALLCHRDVRELVLSTPLGYLGLSELCRVIDCSNYGSRMVTLIIRLNADLDVAAVLEALAEVTPNLEQLSLDQSGLAALVGFSKVMLVYFFYFWCVSLF